MTIEWTEEIITRICDELASGGELYKIAGKDGIPSKASIYRQMARDEAFETRIMRAREAQQHAVSDLNIELADEATTEDWQVKRLQIWARQWRAAKLAPKRYGERSKSDDDKPDDESKIITIRGGLPD